MGKRLFYSAGHVHTILSIPRGPRLVRTASATDFAVSMLLIRTSFFFEFSLERINGAERAFGPRIKSKEEPDHT